jgi:hypothetical protein
MAASIHRRSSTARTIPTRTTSRNTAYQATHATLRTTLRQYGRRWLRKHVVPLLGGRRHGDFDNNPALIRSWRSELLASGASSTAKAYRLLRAVLMTAVDGDLIRRNPCRRPRAGSKLRPSDRRSLSPR